jgi:hypothetical protein
MKKTLATAIICLLLVSTSAVFVPVPPTKAAGIAPVPGYYETSEYLLGKVAVGVILLESNGTVDPSTEDWNSTKGNSSYQRNQQRFILACESEPRRSCEFHL